METLKLKAFNTSDKDISAAAQILKNGGVVAIPTETVYGLAANALDTNAVKKIFAAKGRPQDNPLIVHISKFDEIYDLVTDVPDTAKLLADAFWPGPLTMVLPKSDIVPSVISAGLDTVAVRMPSHPIAREIIKQSGCPLAAPSANISGKPSPTTAEHVVADMDSKIDAVVISDQCSVGVESTVILLANGQKRLLRPGGITVEMLTSVIGDIDIDDAVLTDSVTEKVSSPGMKYKHYSPNTNVVLVNGSTDQFVKFITNQTGSIAAICYEEDCDKIEIPLITYGNIKNEASLAQGIFDALRKVDNLNVKTAYVHAPNKNGIGLAVYNRLLRAAAFEVIDL